MQPSKEIQYLRSHELNKASWNRCIDEAGNGLVYAYSGYLDAMADNWGALVLNDYEAVMPLAYRRKYGIHYLYQPFLVAQLGLFGKNISAEMLERFLDSIPSQFRLWEFPLNHGNLFTDIKYPLYARKNYVLPLDRSYEDLHASYRENTRRNIRKSRQYGCEVKKGIAIEEVVRIARQQAPGEPGFDRFEKLYRELEADEKGVCYGAYSRGGELLASCALLFSHNRAYYLLVGNHPNGRTLGASHALIDGFIHDNSGKKLLLDFEGSDIRNLAFFYSSFGAVEEDYAAIKFNRLPWIARLLKK